MPVHRWRRHRRQGRRLSRRQRLLLCCVAPLGLGLLVHQGATASIGLPATTTAQIGCTTVTGGIGLGRSDTVAGDGRTIISVVVKIRGSLVLKSVTATFGGASVSCSQGLYNLLSNTTPVTCSGLSQDSRASSTLTLAVG